MIKMKSKNMKAQDSIELSILLSILLIITLIVIGFIYKISSTGDKQVKNINVNFISSFNYLSSNSIYLTITENYSFSNFTIITYPYNKYNYTVMSKGINNYGNFAIIGNSTKPYPSYDLKNICSLTFKVDGSKYAYAKNCSQ